MAQLQQEEPEKVPNKQQQEPPVPQPIPEAPPTASPRVPAAATAGGGTAGSAFHALAGGGDEAPAQDGGGGSTWTLWAAAAAESAFSDLEKVGAGVTAATANAVGMAVNSAIAELNEPLPPSDPSKKLVGGGPSGLIGMLGAVASGEEIPVRREISLYDARGEIVGHLCNHA